LYDNHGSPSVRLVPEDRKRRMLKQLNNHMLLEQSRGVYGQKTIATPN